jgi:hypothetical protein
MKKGDLRSRFALRPSGVLVALTLTSLLFFMPGLVLSADRLVVNDASGTINVFKVEDNGKVSSLGTTFPVSKIQRLVSFTTAGRGVAAFELVSSGNMVDGFGPSFEFWISDNTHTASKAIVAMVAGRDGSDTSGKWELLVGNNGTLPTRMTVRSNGNVGIGTGNPVHPLQMGSGAYCTTGGVWTSASSREYKQDIKELTRDEAMETLNGLNPVKFAYKSDADEKHVGFIAEDVPELVATKDKKGTSAMDMVAVLTKVVQEQQKTIAELSKKMGELEKELKAKDKVAMATTN